MQRQSSTELEAIDHHEMLLEPTTKSQQKTGKVNAERCLSHRQTKSQKNMVSESSKKKDFRESSKDVNMLKEGILRSHKIRERQ